MRRVNIFRGALQVGTCTNQLPNNYTRCDTMKVEIVLQPIKVSRNGKMRNWARDLLMRERPQVYTWPSYFRHTPHHHQFQFRRTHQDSRGVAHRLIQQLSGAHLDFPFSRHISIRYQTTSVRKTSNIFGRRVSSQFQTLNLVITCWKHMPYLFMATSQFSLCLSSSMPFIAEANSQRSWVFWCSMLWCSWNQLVSKWST